MRVLWLTASRLPTVAGDGAMIGEGWLEGLRSALNTHCPDLELAIAAPGPPLPTPLVADRTRYFSLGPFERPGRSRRIMRAWLGRPVSDEVIARAASVIDYYAPDLIHIHGAEHAVGKAALAVQRPVLLTLQGFATVCERFMFEALTPAETLEATMTRLGVTGHGPVSGYLRMRRRAADEALLLRSFNAFSGQTDWDRSVLRAHNAHATYYRTGRVLQSAYYETQWRPRSDGVAPTVFCTTSPAPYKGVEVLLAGFEHVRRAHPQARLRVAGALPGSQLWAALQRRTRRLGLAAAVDWLGALEAPDLARELERASVFVLPSHVENESNALIEAMMVGVPCVAAAVGGVPELVIPSETGWLYHDRDPYALAAAVEAVLSDPEGARRLADAARTLVRERHAPEKVAREVMSTYEAVVAGYAAKRRT